ncbi:hypothetical protein AB0M47_06445 [Hamadaea sp. NPDC051192]|uniref:hypothetical protein n=1 Tax=Hamadaea sp. NPDC051192 TaxID=3154940 RepID=UPI0034461776
MTVARKGSRRIVVDGVQFRWTVRRRPTYCQGNGWTPLIFVAEPAAGPGGLLVVSMPWAHPGNWLGHPTGAVRPAMVAASIREALARGWQPAKLGPPMKLAFADLAEDADVERQPV